MHFFQQHRPVIAPSAPPKAVQQMSNHIRFLENELERFSEEIQVRVDRSRREKSAREALSRECDMLREEIGEGRSALEMREREINELERQLRSSETQLVLLRRRHAAVRSEKSSPSPGTISSFPREMRTMGTQINEINQLEERIVKLGEALKMEKKRNERIKLLMFDDASSPRPVAIPPFPGGVLPRRGFVMESLPRTVINRAYRELSRQSFIHLNSKYISEPPPTDVHLLSPIKKLVNTSVYSVFEDKENGGTLSSLNLLKMISSPEQVKRKNNVLVERSRRVPPHEEILSPPPRGAVAPPRLLEPPPFVPNLNLATALRKESSELAIKRAVAAAVEKRKQLASQGILLGSSRSNISTSSFMTNNSPINVSGVKARFCLPLT